MRRLTKFLLCAALIVSCGLSLFAIEPKRVLILNSYHSGYQWTDDQTRGAIDGLSASRTHVKVYIEYMGAKWVSDANYLEQLRKVFALKYRNVHFDAIIATDNDAFNFLKANRDSLFGKIPTVFSGVNHLNTEDLRGATLMTGMNETIDFTGNIDLVLRLHPKTKRVALITDTSITGKRIHQELVEAIPRYKNRLQFTFLEDVNFGDLLESVSKLPPDTVILYTFFFKDKSGAVFDFDDSALAVSQTARVPIYGAWDFNLNHGIIGGDLLVGFDQGHLAGEMAARVLNGEDVDTIPIVWTSPHRYMFDYEQMQRFGISRIELPRGSVIINAPLSYYQINKRLVWGVVGSTVVLTLMVAVLAANIFSRRRAEAALLESEKQMSNIIDFLPDATFVIDKNGKVIAWNRAMQEVTGVRKEDIVGREYTVALPMLSERDPNPLDLVGARNQDAVGEHDNLRVRGTSIMGEVYLPSAFNGRGAHLWAMASPLLNREGSVIGAIESIRDITDQKQAAMDLLNTQEELRQAAKMEAVGRLAGGIAHDFNNQLTVVQGYCSLLLKKIGADESSRELVMEIMRAAERSIQLTSQLLAFSRKQILHPKTVDLTEVLSNLSGPLSRIIGENVHVDFEMEKDVWPVDLDRNQLEQAVMNLAINARDAMPDGGKLTIALKNIVLGPEYVLSHSDASVGAHVVLSVSDTGAGMDEGIQHKIFEPFFTTKGVGKGTGLGLAMVYGFVSQSGGHLEVVSGPGQGACFNLYFPRSAGAVSAESTAAADLAPKGTETILVVEDDNSLRSLVVHVLETGGYNVLQAADGNAGIAVVREYQPKIDLMLCDVVMPGLSGPDTVKQVKQYRPGLKVVYVTGYAEKPIPDEPDSYLLSKPFTPETLFKFIRQVLDERREDIEACA